MPAGVMNIHRLYGLFSRVFRAPRIEMFYREFDISARSRVLDVGGSTFFWDLASQRALPFPQVTLLNLDAMFGRRDFRGRWVAADARHIPFKDGAFDVVFCNSVLEHVGSWEDQQQVAREIERVGRGYFVQTPNRTFPIEPHLLTPFVHWFPKKIQSRLVPRYTVLSLLCRPSPDEMAALRRICLLDARSLAQLFPDAFIRHERLLGISKSLIAVRR
jgi:hypothetical protein